ncbi:MAG: AI-2E family transporter [Bacteroidales bacterium]
MNNTLRYIIWFLILAVLGLLVWYLRPIVAYLAISGVLALIGSPLVDFLSRPIGNKVHLPRSVGAMITLLVMWAIILGFVTFFVPVALSEASDLSNLRLEDLLDEAGTSLVSLDAFLHRFGLKLPEEFTTREFLLNSAGSVINTQVISGLFSSLAGFLGNAFVAFFSISFITFFFLKEQQLAGKWILLLVPNKHEEPVKRALYSSKKLLMRYFTGLLLEMTGVGVLILVGLLITGLGLKESILVAVFAGVLTVIPYVGPFIGSVFGMFVGLATELSANGAEHLLMTGIWLVLVFSIVHLIDNMVFQPLIYSSSVHAHPLEIFLVILAAGSLWGIPGMIAAIPSYTVLRVFSREFIDSFHIVEKLTGEKPSDQA